jgi:hypothetical protein
VRAVAILELRDLFQQRNRFREIAIDRARRR